MAVVLSEILDIPFFRELAEKVEPVLLQSLVGKCSRKHYPSNRIVFRQGEPADSIYIVEEGRVQFLTQFRKSLRDGQDKQPKEQYVVGAGQLIAEINIGREPAKRTVTVRTVVQTTLIQIPSGLYLDLQSMRPRPLVVGATIPLCQLLPATERFKFEREAATRVYNYNQPVYHINDTAKQVFFIVAGQFRRQDDQGFTVAYLEASCTFGHEEIINRTDRRYSIICSSSEAIVYVFGRTLFEEYFMGNPYVLRSLRSAERLHDSVLKGIVGDTRRLEKEKSEEQQLKGRCRQRKTLLPNYSDNSFFAKAKHEDQFINHFSLLRSHRSKKDNESGPKPWFTTSTKKLVARMQRLKRLTSAASK